jgi:nicotinate-nucleotide adenylyltransferase
MCAKRRVALYGGTFDPVHNGHLDVARRVSTLFEIEQVLFIPAQIAPHKLGRTVSAPIHRYAMLALATQHDPVLAISTFELDAPDRRYTIDTVAHFQSYLADSELFFIMGADSWVEITTWREWEKLLTAINHIVVTRPGYVIGEGPMVVRDRIVDLRGETKKIGQLSESGPRIFLTDVVMKDIAATNIRRLAREGSVAELSNLVPEPVAEYVKKYEVY